MKYMFQVKVFKTYYDEDIEVEVELTNDEVARIKELVASSTSTNEEPVDEDAYVPEPDLLLILEDGEPKLFKKFWDAIMPPVFVEMLINGIENGYIEKYDEDDFDYDNEDDFDDIQDMYSDDIELEHSSCCICKIPADWKSQ